MSRSQLSLRATIVVAAVLALALTRPASQITVLPLELIVIGLALFCAWRPDGYTGLVVVLAVALNWVLAVETPMSAWSVGVAAGLALFHTAVAAASVAPSRPALNEEMMRRWLSRLLVVAALPVPVWLVAMLINNLGPGPSPVVFATSFVGLSFAGFWLHRRTLTG